MVSRVIWDHEAAGSSPVIPTDPGWRGSRAAKRHCQGSLRLLKRNAAIYGARNIAAGSLTVCWFESDKKLIF